jgi:hypothetical protein
VLRPFRHAPKRQERVRLRTSRGRCPTGSVRPVRGAEASSRTRFHLVARPRTSPYGRPLALPRAAWRGHDHRWSVVVRPRSRRAPWKPSQAGSRRRSSNRRLPRACVPLDHRPRPQPRGRRDRLQAAETRPRDRVLAGSARGADHVPPGERRALWSVPAASRQTITPRPRRSKPSAGGTMLRTASDLGVVQRPFARCTAMRIRPSRDQVT